MEIEEIAECSHFENVIKENVALVDFFAEWHMQCLTQAPIIEELSEKFRKKMKFCRVNVDENNEIASKCRVGSLPTIIVFKNGQEVCRLNGCLGQEDIENKISEVVG